MPNDLQHGGAAGTPDSAVEVDKHEHAASHGNGAVQEQLVRDESDFSEEPLPEVEANHYREANLQSLR